MEYWVQIILGVLTLIGSNLLSFVVAQRKAVSEIKKSEAEANQVEGENKRDDFSMITDLLKEDNKRLRAEMDSVKELVSALGDKIDVEREEYERKISDLRIRLTREEKLRSDLASQLVLFETSHHDLPLPQWLKDLNGIMLSVNDAYVEAFIAPSGRTRADYVGKTDVEFWGKEIGTEYHKNDQVVRSTRRAVSFMERVDVAGADLSDEFVFLKYPRFKGRTLIGIGGICFPVSYYENAKKYK